MCCRRWPGGVGRTCFYLTILVPFGRFGRCSLISIDTPCITPTRSFYQLSWVISSNALLYPNPSAVYDSYFPVVAITMNQSIFLICTLFAFVSWSKPRNHQPDVSVLGKERALKYNRTVFTQADTPSALLQACPRKSWVQEIASVLENRARFNFVD